MIKAILGRINGVLTMALLILVVFVLRAASLQSGAKGPNAAAAASDGIVSMRFPIWVLVYYLDPKSM